jgi:arginine/lysine/ornithine decarboxylase
MIGTLDAGISGYQAADWLWEDRAINVGLFDHRRVLAQFTFADDQQHADRLVSALGDLTRTSLSAPTSVVLPEPGHPSGRAPRRFQAGTEVPNGPERLEHFDVDLGAYQALAAHS